MTDSNSNHIENEAFSLSVSLVDREVRIHLVAQPIERILSDGEYSYQAISPSPNGAQMARGLVSPSVHQQDGRLEIHGQIAGLTLVHCFKALSEGPFIEEQIFLTNPTQETIHLQDFSAGFRLAIGSEIGEVLPPFSEDRVTAIPFLHRPTDPPGWINRFTFSELLTTPGREYRVPVSSSWYPQWGQVPSLARFSEGWAWVHGDSILGIFKINQQAMEFSALVVEPAPEAVYLRYAGVACMNQEPSAICNIPPGGQVAFGVTRLHLLPNDERKTSYAFRSFLDEQGCRFPDDYDPPVHWNELYDNPEWNLGTPGSPSLRRTRPLTYSREQIFAEAAKARDYHCQALYLDPGWDTAFGTLLWGEDWLGAQTDFVQHLARDYGLKLSLHCPLATWMSLDGRGVASWPRQAARMDRQGNLVEGSLCLGSRQYLDEAEKRLLALCQAGATFLMFDGNWYPSGCWNPSHGHPVPYNLEAHCQANYELARRVHARYPSVLIEMHDAISGGSLNRYTPVYYHYGLPGSYDENWGFELMWEPMEDLISGRARALYDYNQACNVPLYLHIDLREDNRDCLVFWWYASTCRHLGIGGEHADLAVTQAHRQAMRRYRQLERFYKRGEFFGMNEEIHLHALPQENAFVINLFNLSDQSRRISGSISFEQMGLDRDRWYINPFPSGEAYFNPQTGTYHINRRLPPWSAQVALVQSLPGERKI